MKSRKLILTSSLIAFILILSGCEAGKNKIGPLGSTHRHIDIKVYILGNSIDFSQQKYQLRSQAVHFENRDGDVVHTHATGITLGYAFQTLGMSINDNCLTLETGNQYCSDGNAKLKVYIKNSGSSWRQIFEPSNYAFQDNDKALVTYGTEDEDGINKQLESVTDKAPTT